MEASRVLAQTTTYQYDGSGASWFGGVFLLLWLPIVLAVVAGLWKTFEKAGRPGWAALVPFYNTYTLLKIAGRPAWWLLLYFIPFVNIVITAIVAVDIAKAFGRSEVFGIVALWLFSIVGFLMLGFGDDTYQGSKTT